MTELATHLATVLRDHLPRERRASPHTYEAYSDSYRLLVAWAAWRILTKSCELMIEQLPRDRP